MLKYMTTKHTQSFWDTLELKKQTSKAKDLLTKAEANDIKDDLNNVEKLTVEDTVGSCTSPSVISSFSAGRETFLLLLS